MAAEVLYETFLQSSRVEILLNFCAKNPPHRQAEKRCVTLLKKRLDHGNN